MLQWLSNNLDQVQNNVTEATLKSGRTATDIKIVAVSKTVNIDVIKVAFKEGMTDFGENRVQEFLDKFSALPQATWHLIGHLQTNKVKYIIDKVALIHSVDSISLAEEISKRAVAKELVTKILIQVNVAQEETKFGLELNEVEDFIDEVKALPGIKIEGLMTIAPYVTNPEEVRGVFKALKTKFDNLKEIGVPKVDMTWLSMGMSNDYKVAIEEGSNMVRIGSDIFGERN